MMMVMMAGTARTGLEWTAVGGAVPGWETGNCAPGRGTRASKKGRRDPIILRRRRGHTGGLDALSVCHKVCACICMCMCVENQMENLRERGENGESKIEMREDSSANVGRSLKTRYEHVRVFITLGQKKPHTQTHRQRSLPGKSNDTKLRSGHVYDSINNINNNSFAAAGGMKKPL